MLLTGLSLFAKDEEWEFYEKGEILITETRLKLRDGQGTKAQVITVLPEQTVIQVLEEGENEEIDEYDDYWIRVKAILQENGKEKTYEGWVFGGYTLPLDDTNTSEYKDKKCAVGFYDTDIDENDSNSPIMHTLYFVNKKTLKTIKSFSYINRYHPKKKCSIRTGLTLDESRSLLYLGLSYSTNGENVQYIYRIDISKPEATDVVISMDKITGDQNFINKNIKLMLYNKTTADGKRECNLTGPLTLYTNCTFKEKMNETLPADKKAIFKYYSSKTFLSPIYLDEKKKGFGLWVDVYEKDGPGSYGIWIE